MRAETCLAPRGLAALRPNCDDRFRRLDSRGGFAAELVGPGRPQGGGFDPRSAHPQTAQRLRWSRTPHEARQGGQRTGQPTRNVPDGQQTAAIRFGQPGLNMAQMRLLGCQMSLRKRTQRRVSREAQHAPINSHSTRFACVVGSQVCDYFARQSASVAKRARKRANVGANHLCRRRNCGGEWCSAYLSPNAAPAVGACAVAIRVWLMCVHF